MTYNFEPEKEGHMVGTYVKFSTPLDGLKIGKVERIHVVNSRDVLQIRVDKLGLYFRFLDEVEVVK